MSSYSWRRDWSSSARVQRLDQPLDRQGVAGRAQRHADARAVEVELALGRGAVGGQLDLGVPAQHLVQQVARLGGVEQVSGDGGIERQGAHVDAGVEQRPHDRLGLVGGDRPAPGRRGRHQLAEGGLHGLVGQQLGRQPRHVARAGIGDDGQALERRAALAALPRRGQRQRLARPPARTSPRMRTASAGVSSALTSASSTSAGAPPTPRSSPRASVSRSARLWNSRKSNRRRTSSTSGSLRSRSSTVTPTGTSTMSCMSSAFCRTLRLVLGEVGAQLGRLLVEVLEDAVDAAVGGDELGGRLLADARHARQVVGRVAPQRRVLEVEAGRHARASLDALLVVEHVVGHAAPVVEHLDVRVLHQLVHVAVARDHDDVEPGVAALRGQRGDDVVGLVARRGRAR